MTARGLASGLARQLASGLAGSGGGAANPAYQILVKTDNAGTSSSTQFTLPATGTYDIDWGDGTLETLTGAQTHTYGSAGNYVIKVTGGLTRITFNDGGDRLKLIEVQNWGDAVWSSFEAAYRGCSNCHFNATDTLVLPANCTNAFRSCTSFNQSVSNFDTSSVTSMAAIFTNCTAFNQSVSNFDTSLVTNMSSMFANCSAFNQSVSNFDTSLVTTMESMFQTCNAFNQSVSSFSTSAVTNMVNMFVNCTAFKQSVATFSLAGLNSTARLNGFAQATNINAASTTSNYDATLIAWAAQLPLTHVQSPNFGTAQYSAGAAATARAELVTAGWTITDGGLDFTTMDLDADALDYFSRARALGGSFSQTTINPTYTEEYVVTAIDDFVRGCKTDSIWTKLTEIYLLSGVTFGGLMAKLKHAGTAVTTNVGPFVTGDYVAAGSGAGLVGNGSTKSLDTQFTPSNIMTNCSYGGYATGNFGGSAFMGARSGGFVHQFSGFAGKHFHFGNPGRVDYVSSPTVGMYVGTGEADNIRAYFNGSLNASLGSAGTSGGTPSTLKLYQRGDGAEYSNGRSTFAFCCNDGFGLTSTDALNLSNRTNALMTALGANVY